MLFFVLLRFQSELGRGKGSAVPKSKIPKNIPSRKNATRRPHKQNMCRCAGRAFGAGARLLHIEFLMCSKRFFLRRSRNARKSQWFFAVSTHRKRSGCRLAAFSGPVLGALWLRSGGVLGSARPCQLPELAFRPSTLAL